MMGTHKWHGSALNDEQLEIALNQNKETLEITNKISGNIEMKDTRSGFGTGLTELGKTNENISWCFVSIDLTGSLKIDFNESS